MKLDLNKPWIMHLVNQNSTVNGCSFIRGVILRTIWNAILWTVAVTFGCLLVAALIGGGYMLFHEPSYFYAGYENRLSYFGEGWVAQSWAVLSFIGGLIWALAGFIGAAILVIWALVNLLNGTGGAIRNATGKVWTAVAPSNNFVEAVSAVYHKFCPQLEIILPKGYEGYVVGARVQKLHKQWNEAGTEVTESWRPGTITVSKLDGNRLELEVMWDHVREDIKEYFTRPDVIEEYDTPEELEESLNYIMSVRSGEHRLWFKHTNSDFKLLVEETDSPQ